MIFEGVKGTLPAAILSSIIVSHNGYAQSQLTDSSAIERIITTASRAEQQVNSLPFSIATLDEPTLQNVASVQIEEVLRYVAGASFHRGNGMEYLPALRSPVLSGAGACGGLLTAEDGIPLRAAGFCNINELFEAHSEMAERIEVLKGPGSAFYGSNAVHGVINVITPDTTSGRGLIGLDIGSYGYTRAKLRSGHQGVNGGIGVNASVTRDTGYRNDESVKQEKVNLRHRWQQQSVSIDTGFTYTHLDQDTAGYIEGFQSYKDKQAARRNSNPEAFRKAESLRLWSRIVWQPDSNNEFVMTPYVRDQSMQFLMHFLPGTPMENNAQQGAGFQSVWHHEWSSQVTLSLGVDAEYTQGSLLQYQKDVTLGSAFLVATVPQGKHYDYQVDARLLAPFTQVEWQSERWLVTLGVRYESMSYHYTNQMNSGRLKEDGTTCPMGGCRYSRPSSRNDQFNNLSPKLGVSYALRDNLFTFFNIASGYRAPQATELYRLQRAQSVADLDTETVKNVEAGLKGTTSRLQYTVSAYLMNKENVIFRDSNYFNVSNGKTRHLGIEAELDFAISPQWQLSIAASRAEHTYANDSFSGDININGNDIDSAPSTVANARLTWKPDHGMQNVLEWQHVGTYFTDPENAHGYSGHDLLNFRTLWQLSAALTIHFRVINLLDDAYAERADYTSFSGDRYFPGRPRHYTASMI
ncbi:MAG: TonB-dependent receptor [Oceanospirillum sp.]|nr:TonB-dependent receptor [Oceanospirillum sp.]